MLHNGILSHFSSSPWNLYAKPYIKDANYWPSVHQSDFCPTTPVNQNSQLQYGAWNFLIGFIPFVLGFVLVLVCFSMDITQQIRGIVCNNMRHGCPR